MYSLKQHFYSNAHHISFIDNSTVYRQHFASDLPLRLMEEMIIGRLHPDDQDNIDIEMDKLMEEDGDPYEDEPDRHPLLIVHSVTIFTAIVVFFYTNVIMAALILADCEFCTKSLNI